MKAFINNSSRLVMVEFVDIRICRTGWVYDWGFAE